jgi:hypothetical protein
MLSEAVPDAYLDARGIVRLPATTIYLDMPICEFSQGNSVIVFGQGAGKTIIVPH